MPIAVAIVTRSPRTKGVLVLSRTSPMSGTESRPPTGKATSKKLLISTALSKEPSMCSYCGLMVATKKLILVIWMTVNSVIRMNQGDFIC